LTRLCSGVPLIVVGVPNVAHRTPFAYTRPPALGGAALAGATAKIATARTSAHEQATTHVAIICVSWACKARGTKGSARYPVTSETEPCLTRIWPQSGRPRRGTDRPGLQHVLMGGHVATGGRMGSLDGSVVVAMEAVLPEPGHLGILVDPCLCDHGRVVC